MALGDRTYQWAAHTAWGIYNNHLHNVIEHTFGYTYHKKKVSNAAAAAVLGSTAGSASAQTITAGIIQLDVPRVLAVTIGGSGMSAGSILINGTNIEGKPITDTIPYTTTGQVQGSLVFKLITSIVLPGALGASATVTVDTTNKLGINHRIPPNFGTIVVLQDTQLDVLNNTTKPTVQAAPAGSNTDGQFVEKNWVQPATTPDGTTFLYFFYWFHKVLVGPPKDSPEFYSTTTSTSSSTSSTSTSSTSTSTSISTSSTSTSSTSTSFSSTSTSTTTLPV
jgi:hypothetical protein